MGRFKYIRFFEELVSKDVPVVGGKNASLGEMIGNLKPEGIRVPGGFATTAEAYWEYINANGLREEMEGELSGYREGKSTLEITGGKIRRLFLEGEFPEEIAGEIKTAYKELSRRYNVQEADVAVRSSATAEDLPEASFAGQQETFLNVTGEKDLIESCKKCYASLFTNRAISYRDAHGFDHIRVALSIGVQKMVRSDKAGAGAHLTRPL